MFRNLVTFDICDGNPGALAFVMEAYMSSPMSAEDGFQRMRDNQITGSRLYMLWNDCCGRNTELAILVMRMMPIAEVVRHINYEGGYGLRISKDEVQKHAENGI